MVVVHLLSWWWIQIGGFFLYEQVFWKEGFKFFFVGDEGFFLDVFPELLCFFGG